ncbi:hypothetical protein AAT19DRAFT_14639 [Rhodotorula toruloides]|uniref:Uncharacterized protein n=1 Tax=Rhodotorula toruloides TaxID=5286 RepID=A0A2T0A8Q0_RHOTO|nr:hypothetical protein AAT19DRAFT_14639 [Rhodotorula toruloides]
MRPRPCKTMASMLEHFTLLDRWLFPGRRSPALSALAASLLLRSSSVTCSECSSRPRYTLSQSSQLTLAAVPSPTSLLDLGPLNPSRLHLDHPAHTQQSKDTPSTVTRMSKDTLAATASIWSRCCSSQTRRSPRRADASLPRPARQTRTRQPLPPTRTASNRRTRSPPTLSNPLTNSLTRTRTHTRASLSPPRARQYRARPSRPRQSRATRLKTALQVRRDWLRRLRRRRPARHASRVRSLRARWDCIRSKRRARSVSTRRRERTDRRRVQQPLPRPAARPHLLPPRTSPSSPRSSPATPVLTTAPHSPPPPSLPTNNSPLTPLPPRAPTAAQHSLLPRSSQKDGATSPRRRLIRHTGERGVTRLRGLRNLRRR